MLPAGAFWYYYMHYSSLLTRIAVAVSSSYALPIYVHRFCVLQQAYGTSWKLPMLSEVPILVCSYAIILHYITIISIIFSIISIIPKQKNHFLGWNSLQITGQSHHPSWGIVVRSIQQRSRLNLGPRRCLLPQQGRHRAHHHLGTHDGCMRAIRHAWQDETDRPSYQLIGQSTSSSPATRGQQVQDLDEPAIMRLIDIIHIIHIMDIMRIIDIICITLSAWVSVLNPIFQKMSSIK